MSLRRRFEDELRGLAEKNIMRALVKAFVECYGHYDEARARVKHISDFSTTATIALHEAFKCEK